MGIKFLCPNGHQLTAPDNLSGKPGKCPKCNTPFVVPTPEEDEEPAAEAPSEAPAEGQEAEKSAVRKAAAGDISQGSGKGTIA